MNKKIALIIVFLAAAVGIVIGIRSLKRESHANAFEVNMYFLNETSSSLTAEKQNIKYDNDEDIITLVTEALIKGASGSKSVSIMDKNTKLNSIKKQGSGIVVDFSKEFLSGDQTKNTLAAYAVVKTLCQIPGVHSVKVTVDSAELLGPDGSRLGFLSGDDINLEKDKDSAEEKHVVLYFADGDSGLLSSEIRAIKITDTQPVEQYVINELVKGPERNGLKATLSSDTSVISVETTDGTCFVNFGANFISRNSGTNEKENLAIYSMVNSLTELDNVNNVQFLVDGKKISSFGTNSISGTFFRNNYMIKK